MLTNVKSVILPGIDALFPTRFGPDPCYSRVAKNASLGRRLDKMEYYKYVNENERDTNRKHYKILIDISKIFPAGQVSLQDISCKDQYHDRQQVVWTRYAQ